MDNAMFITKRNGKKVPFDVKKIEIAISKANKEVDKQNQISEDDIKYFALKVANRCRDCKDVTVEDVQNFVEDTLIKYNSSEIAKKYIKYRYERELVRKANTTDDTILSLIRNENKDLAEENSNKSTVLASTQRDYIAGIVSRDITDRILLPKHIARAHKDGVLHFHDADYFIQPIFNCCLVNIGDMLDNGTVMNGKMIESPKSFQVACTVTTQIIAAVASNQYGGQSIDIRHLGKYLRKSKEKFEKVIKETVGEDLSETAFKKLVNKRLKEELSAGVQTIQYQINTLMTTNGQSPFVTLFLYLDKDDEYIEENAMIIEEILRQRLEGIKNEKGVYITPAFPKLVYVLDEINNFSGGKYDYITEMAVKCSAKRMYPDYISAKKMRENYEGNVFSPMGCVDGKEVIVYKFQNRVYLESFERMWDRLSNYFEVKQQQKGNNDYLYFDTDEVEIYDTKKGFVKNKRVIRNLSNNWVRLKFSNGRVLTCTSDHPFETENRGMVLAKDLNSSDVIKISKKTYQDGKLKFNAKKAWMLGLLLCDSSYFETISLSIAKNGEDDIGQRFKDYLHELYGLKTREFIHNRGVRGSYKDINVISSHQSAQKLRNELFSLFGGIKKDSRQIPKNILEWDYKSRLSFLAGMIDADGYINNNNNYSYVQIGSTNKELALQQYYLAQSLGFTPSIYLNHYDKRDKEKMRYRVEFDATKELVDALACEKKKQNFKSNTRNNTSIKFEDTCCLVQSESINNSSFSYDVTTESEHFEVSGLYSHNCRSFLAPWKDKDGNYKFEGRFNQGVVSLNLPQIGIVTKGNEEGFWKELDKRLDLCFEALMCRHEACKKIVSDVSPVHWQYGALARLDKGQSVEELLYGGYSSISLGYIGLYEVTKLVKGVSHTTPEGQEFAVKVMKRLRKATDDWKAKTNIGFALYGTPAESLCYRFARIDKERFGTIEDVTDKGYYTNSYHVDVREEIDAFKKFDFESQFQKISAGGAISYVEIPNMRHNLPALKELVKYIYDHIQYAEFNTKSDYCHVCGYDGEIKINDDNEWECPQCGNKDHAKMNVTRRTCGYLGENFWNVGKTKEIKSRVLHI